MNEQAAFDCILSSLHDAALDDARWPAASALIDEACRTKGNHLVIADGQCEDDIRVIHTRILYRGERRVDFERGYFDVYYPVDERPPRIRCLPDSQVVHVTELYTDAERKASVAYNEGLSFGQMQYGLNVRLEGPNGSRITFCLGNSTDRDGWTSARVSFIERLLPHLRQYARVRQALANVTALGTSLTGLLDKTGAGIIQLDARGRIVAANDRVTDLLRQKDALIDDDGLLGARLPPDNGVLHDLLARALPRFGEQGTGGSVAVSRPDGEPGLTVHVTPVGEGGMDSPPGPVAALVLVLDHAPARIDPAVVGASLGLTPTESLVASLLAEGKSVREIVLLTGRAEKTVRWHIEQIYQKRGISRQVDLVRQVLSLRSPSEPPR